MRMCFCWFWYLFIYFFLSDPIFWWCWCCYSSVLWHPLPEGQPTKVSVLQRPPQSPAQTTQGICLHILHRKCGVYQIQSMCPVNANKVFKPFWFPFFSEGSGVSHLASADLWVCQPRHGSFCAAQRAANRRRVHQGGICSSHLAWPHTCFQAARAHPGRQTQKHY